MFSSAYTHIVPMHHLQDTYDFIIVGGGTAGCVIASRLSENPEVTVLLIERGDIADSWVSRIPLFSSHFSSDGSRSKVWKSAPQPSLGGRKIDLVGGASLGGASKINAMLYTRGLPAEYDLWNENGAKGWSYDQLLPFFTRSERHLGKGQPVTAAPKVSEKKSYSMNWHNMEGEWENRSHATPFWRHTDQIIQAASSLGLPYIEDPNAPFAPPRGCAKMHFNISQNGERSSTYTAFLKQIGRRPNLHVCVRTVVQRIEITKAKDFASAHGVWITGPASASRLVGAAREVILTAGPIASPHLLLLSGIGPSDHLREHDIPVFVDLKSVGENLQDHLSVPLQYQVPVQDSLAKIALKPWLIIKELILYILFGLGLFLAPVLELSIFVQTRLLDERGYSDPTKVDKDAYIASNLPDIEVMPISWGDVSQHGSGGLTFFTVTLRPTSKGSVRLNSNDPSADPVIDPRYLSTTSDWQTMRQGLKFVMRLKDQILRQGYPILPAHLPASEDDDDLDAFIRIECQSTNHYTSTCRISASADLGVVDHRLKVHGVSRLRVADSSVFPYIISTHLAATTVAIAERCADIVLEDMQY